MWLKFIKFNYLLPKMKLFVVWLVKIQDLLGWQQDFIIQPYYVEVTSAMKFFARNAFATNFFIAKQSRIDCTTREIKQKYPQDAPWQKLSILLDEPRHTTICHYISSFDKISIKSSKKCDLLATLMKFSQTSNPHLSYQRKFVKTNAVQNALSQHKFDSLLVKFVIQKANFLTKNSKSHCIDLRPNLTWT